MIVMFDKYQLDGDVPQARDGADGIQELTADLKKALPRSEAAKPLCAPGHIAPGPFCGLD